MNGNNFFKISIILFVLQFFFCCGSIKQDVIKYNYFNGDYFYNDSLKIGIDFWGALDFTNLQKIKKAALKTKLKDFKQYNVDDLIVNAVRDDKTYEMYFFYQKLENVKDNLIHQKMILDDTINGKSILEKQKGDKKVICIVVDKEKRGKYCSTLAKEVMRKIEIDSLNATKLSFNSVFNYYGAIKLNNLQARKKILTSPLAEKPRTNMKFQMLLTANSFLGNNKAYDSIIFHREENARKQSKAIFEKLKSDNEVSHDKKVFDAISEIAKNNQIIILNEDHYYPKHRLFAMQLLDILKQNNYKYISLEAFIESKKSDYIPNSDNGIYTNEPFYGHFLRKAKQMDLTILGHENMDSKVDREIGQAQNIKKILDQDPKAKIFAYVGHSHLEKKGSKKKWMAQHLMEMTNIEPVTIDQRLFADTNEELTFFSRIKIEKDSLTNCSADYFLVNNLKADLKAIYPEKEFKDVELKSKNFKKYQKQEVMVQVYDKEEYILLRNLKVSLFNQLSTAVGDKINLNLPIGNYRIIIKTEDDETLYNEFVEVK